MGQKISEMTDVGAGALSTDQLELARSNSSTSFRIAISALATFVRGVASALTATTVTMSGYAVITGFQPGGLGASKTIVDFFTGAARWFSMGADAATNGIFRLSSQRSDGSNAIDVLTSDVTGRIAVVGSTPASAVATGAVGTVTWDASFVYVCIAANTWKRAAISTW